MLCCKKVLNTDLLQLALAVILLRLNPENYFNNRQWNENSEVREIFLGANSAYAQSNFHASRGRLRPYSYPKNIDSIVLDETLSVFEHINYYGSLNQFRHRRNDFLAFYSSSNQSQNTQRRTDDHEISHHGQEVSTNESQENSNNASDVCVETQCSAAQNDSEGNFSNSPMNLDLTREDMDLIEILWKQDIDLGVSRDAFDSRESHEVDKLKPSKNHKELQLEENFNEIEKFQDEATPFSDPWEGLNYTIDSETGEHVIQEQLYLEEAPEINDEESLFSEEVLNELSENLYLPLTDNNEEFMSLTTNETFFNLLESHDNEALDDQDHMLSQLDNLEKMIKKEESFTPYFSEDQEMVSDLFPSTEDCWQDITTTLPLSVMGSTHNEASLSLFTRPLQSYSGITGNNSVPILNHPASTSDSSNGILIHNATLASPAADMNNSISYISATLGPSSIGCAVAASMATLTNDTEPVPDGSMVNTTYHPEFTELMYSNHTSAPSQGEYLLSDLLLEEDLQLIEMGNSAEANYTNHLGGSGENMDASSDSAVSLTSGRVPSISDCPEWVDSCSESSHQGEHDSNYLSIEGSLPLSLNTNITRSFVNHQNSHQYSTAFPHSVAQKKYKLFGKKVTNNVEEIENENGDYKEFASQNCHKDEIYMSAKHSSNELAVASTYGPISMEGAAAPHDQDFTINIPIASGGSYAQYPQHNHSYHLPFVSSSYTQKPLMRDKTKGGNGDEETLNRDEKRARALKLPITIDDIINLAIDEFNEKLSKYELTEPQLTLIRDIRRRGKNKVAAQNCRKRKMDQITVLQQDIDLLQSERLQLETEQTRLLQHRRYYQDKYTQLYEFVAQACSQTQHPDSFHPLLPNEDNAAPSHLVALEPDKDTDLNRGARTKRKFEKK